MSDDAADAVVAAGDAEFAAGAEGDRGRAEVGVVNARMIEPSAIDSGEYVEVIARSMTEKDLARNVDRALREFGWLSYHSWLSVRSSPGFPDIVAIKQRPIGSLLLVVELKAERGRVSPHQQAWLDAFAEVGATVCIFRPSDWLSNRVLEVLAA